MHERNRLQGWCKTCTFHYLASCLLCPCPGMFSIPSLTVAFFFSLCGPQSLKRWRSSGLFQANQVVQVRHGQGEDWTNPATKPHQNRALLSD